MIALAYVKIVALPGNAFAGGVMVVDGRGLPLDFRYTEPVQPSKVQQVLYGKSLDRHVRQDVIFKQLAAKIDPRPALVLVDDEILLGLAAAASVALVVETRLTPLREVALVQTVTDQEVLLQAGETGSPLRVKIAKAEPGGAEKAAEALLEAARQGLDLTEPFNRIRGALEVLCSASSARE
ncbi:MAG: hypothetical protein JWM80_3718 [Cyanobacteria bacterium RYN_339]|nr:hypothetical protein [Cyanobacteria bacterium RYN_339]